jgi:hypothetical protein
VKGCGFIFLKRRKTTTAMPRVATRRKTGIKMVSHRGATALQKVSLTQ